MNSLTERYLELLKKSLLDELYIENEARLVYLLLSLISQSPVDVNVLRDIAKRQPHLVATLREGRKDGKACWDWTFTDASGKTQMVSGRNFFEFYHTMIGRARLNNIHELLNKIIADEVPGDLIEAGVWRGGATILMRGFLAAHNVTGRTVWVADSFAGLPPPSLPQDAGCDLTPEVYPILSVSRDEVADLFARYDLLDESVRFLEGWFKDTLPAAPIERLALIRLDGDLYESTMDGLESLYPKLSPGGYIIIDDYGVLEPSRQAVEDYRARRQIEEPIQTIDWSGVFWRKRQ